jgi:NAD(P)H dehydrogenase (quinone)
MNIYIVYDSQGGHTEALAQAIAEGAGRAADANVHLHTVGDADVYDLTNMDAIIWGSPGHFGTISAGLKSLIDKLGYLWAKGQLIDKVGAVFCTTATEHGGLEATLLNLITPMLHQGMVIVGLPGNIPENAVYGSYYGVGITCPIDSTELISENGKKLGIALGERVANVTRKLVK